MFKKKAIIFAALFMLSAATVTAALEDELAADKSKDSFIANGDFSEGSVSSSDFRGAFKLREGEGINGSNAVEVEQGAAVCYIMKDLQPNTAYTFAAYFKTLELEGGDPPCIVIKGWGGDDIYSPAFKDLDYMRAEHSFMSGGEVKREVEFHVWNVTSGPIMVDSMFLYLYEAPAPAQTDPPAEPPADNAAPENAQESAGGEGAPAQTDPPAEPEPGGNTALIVVVIIAAAVFVTVFAVIAVRKKKSK